MVRQLVLLSAATLLVAACMFLPFLPGEYDGLAVTLSAMAQFFGVVGLLLVPFGIVWLVHELRMRPANAGTRPGKDWQYALGLASIGAATIVAVLISFFVLSGVGPALWLGVMAVWVYCAWRLAARLKARSNAKVRTFNPAPLYLVVVPIVAAILTVALVGLATEISRNRAIENSAGLIGDIERYHDVHGHYPPSLLSVWKDYKPSMIGVSQYHYEPNGDAYNVYFEHPAVNFGTREFVMYNKRDEHEMTSHCRDLLLLTPTELAVQRGYYAVHEASRPHWKYFWFD